MRFMKPTIAALALFALASTGQIVYAQSATYGFENLTVGLSGDRF